MKSTKALGQKYMYYFGQVTKPLFNLNFLIIKRSEALNTSIYLFIKHWIDVSDNRYKQDIAVAISDPT